MGLERFHGFREGLCVQRGFVCSERVHVFREGSCAQ